TALTGSGAAPRLFGGARMNARASRRRTSLRPAPPAGRESPGRGGPMHPSFYYRWKCARRAAGGEASAHAGGFGPTADAGGHGQPHASAGRWWAGHREGLFFGVRRPLRFMAHRLNLDDEQVQALARILNEIKTE